MFDYKVFRAGSDVLVAIADSSIVGKKFSEGGLELEVKRDFYGGMKCDERKAVKIVNSATIVNAVGKDIVSLLLKKGFVDGDKVIKVQKIPHAQIVVVK
ncbi:MAG: DUF424 family protein [Candidatus Aenigmarchaeota archaeon]|nr:DUF424 family protein [Candidatus Aenigmarchaeota archaeon]